MEDKNTTSLTTPLEAHKVPTDLAAPTSPILQEATERANHYVTQSKSENTRRVYRSALRQYVEWCDLVRRPHFPTDMSQAGLYLAYRAQELAPKSLDVHISAIAAAYRAQGLAFDTRHPAISTILSGVRRTKKSHVPYQAQALTIEHIRTAISALDLSTPSGLRMRALLLIGFGLGARRSELIDLQRQHIQFDPRGVEVLVAQSKTDQTGEGTYVGLCSGPQPEFCPRRALKEWMDAQETALRASAQTSFYTLAEVPVFTRIRKGGQISSGALSGQSVTDLIKKSLENGGMPSDGFSAHSLRAGLITASKRLGLDLDDVMAQSRHKDRATALGYVRRESIWENNITAELFTQF